MVDHQKFFFEQTYGGIEEVRQERRNHALSKNITVQPYLIVVGDKNQNLVESVYLCINDIIYEMPSIITGLDVCFQSFHVLNAVYTRQSEQIWLLLQVGLYRFRTVWDAQLNNVDEVLHDMGLNLDRI